MKHKLISILIATCAYASAAAAKQAPSAPDFQHRTPTARVDGAHTASNATAMVQPVDVIPFDFDSSKLDRVDRLQVQQAAQWLETHPGYRIVIEAHTDASGAAAYNAGLATRRARAVRDEIVKLGIAPDRVVAAIYGEAKPQARDRFAASNRVVIMYATTMTPKQIINRTLPIGTAVVWA
jgi:outer membrane protein OmpA-like peptidoglycan-associated protein